MELKVPIGEVYKTVEGFKKETKRALEASKEAATLMRTSKSKDQEVISRISAYLEKEGIYGLKLGNLRRHLECVLP